MMDTQITCDTKGEVDLDCTAKAKGISIVLDDEKHVPVAKYEFSSEKTSRITRLLYEANNVRIHFYGDIAPTMIFEHTSFND